MKKIFFGMFALQLMAGCVGGYWEDGYIGDGYDSIAVVGYEGDLSGAAMDPSMGAAMALSSGLGAMGVTPEEAAQKAAERFEARMKPKSCASTQVTGATVVATVDDCNGSHGIVHMTGTITFVFSISGNDIISDITSTNLQVGSKRHRYTIDINSRAVRSTNDGTVTTSISTNGSGIGPRGVAFTRDGNYTVTYDTATGCRTINGSWTMLADDRTVTTTVTNLQRFGTDCPDSGSKVVLDNGSGGSIEMTYDGTGTVKWNRGGIKSGTLKLSCGMTD